MTKNEIKAYLKQNAVENVPDKFMDFVAKEIQSVMFLNIDQVAYRSQFSSEEVEQFIRALGFADFIEFKKGLRIISYSEKKEDKLQRINLKSIADSMMRCEMQNLTEFFNNVDYDLVDQLAQDITAASEVVIIGSRGTKAMSDYAVKMFNHIGIRATQFESRDCYAADYISTLSRSALIITFSCAAYNKVSVMLSRMLKNQGFHIVAVTDSDQAPTARLADYHFVLPLHSYDFSESYTTGILLMNLVIFRLVLSDSEAMLQRLNNYYQLGESMDLFF